MLRYFLLSSLILFSFLVPAAAIADDHDPARIMPAEVMQRLNAGEDIVFLDTRTPSGWAAGTTKIANAYRVTSNEELNQVLHNIPPERLIVTYCT